MDDSYAVVTISKIQIFLPEPMIPSWDLIYNGLEGDSGRDGVKELHTGASFKKGATVKITDQEWTQRVVLHAYSKSALQRKITFHLMKQSKMTSKRRIAMELEFDLNSLVQTHKPQVIVHELLDSKGGKVVIELSCELMAPSMWWDEIRHSIKNSKNRLEKFNLLISQLHEFFTLPNQRSKLIAYLKYKKDAASILFNLFETYTTTIFESETLATKICATRTANSPLFANMTSKQIRKRKRQAKAELEVINGYKTQFTELMAQLLKDSLTRKIFLDAEYLQMVITWACKPNSTLLATAALGSLKPLFASDALQELLGRAGLIHFLIHILNPTTEYGKTASEGIVSAAMQILPYFSNRFHTIFVKADFFPCVEILLNSSVSTYFLRGIELMMVLATTRADEVIRRLMPAFETSLSDLATSIKDTGAAIERLNSHVDKAAALDTTPLTDLDSLLRTCATVMNQYASADKSPVVRAEPAKPIIMNRGFTGQHISVIPSPPAPPPPVPVSRGPVPQFAVSPVVPKIPARERNEMEIRELTRQVGRLLEDPDASTTEVARILDEIERLGTDTPEPSPHPTEPPPEPEPEPVEEISEKVDSDAVNILISADVGLRIESWKLDYKKHAEALEKEDEAKKDDHQNNGDTTASQAPIPIETHEATEEESDPSESVKMEDVETEEKKDEETEEHPASAALKLLAQITSSLDEPISPRHDAPTQSSAPKNDSDEETDPAIPVGADGGLKDSRSRLKRSVNRLTQEISTLEFVAGSIDEKSKKSGKSSLRSSSASQNADLYRVIDEINAILPPVENSDANEIETGGVDDEDAVNRWERLLEELYLHQNEPTGDLDSVHFDLSSDSASDSEEHVTRDRAYTGSTASSSDRYFIGEDGLRAIDGLGGNEIETTSSAPAPAAPIQPSARNSEELVKLRVHMNELEKSVTKLLRPIASLSTGHESEFRASMILNHLVIIMSMCSTSRLKGVILEILTKISAGHNALEMKPGYVEAVLSHALSLLLETPPYTPCPKPPVMLVVRDVLSAPNFKPNPTQMVLFLRLLRIPKGRWRGLSSDLLEPIRSWDLFSLSLEYPSLLHEVSRAGIPERQLVNDIIKKAITIPNHGLSPDSTNLNKSDFDTSSIGSSNHHQRSQAMILVRLIRDSEFMSDLLHSVSLVSLFTSVDLFLPMVEAIVGCKTKLNRAEIAAFDTNAKTTIQNAIGLTQDKQDSNTSQSPKSKSIRSRTSSSSRKATPNGKSSSHEKSSSNHESPSTSPKSPANEKSSTSEKNLTSSSEKSGSTRSKNRKSRLLSSSSKSSSSSGLSSSRMTSGASEEFTLLQLLDGAVAQWEAKRQPVVIRAHASKLSTAVSVCSFMVQKLTVNAFNDGDEAKESQLAFYALLARLPYLNDFVIFAPEEMVTLIQYKVLDEPRFKAVTKLFLKLSSEALTALWKSEFGIVYLSSLLIVPDKARDVGREPVVRKLLTRLCLEANFWHHILRTSNLNDSLNPGSMDRILQLGLKQPQLFLELCKFLTSEQIELLPRYLFEALLRGIHGFEAYGHLVMVDIMRTLLDMPSFWQHIGVYASECQTLLIRIYYGDKRARYPSQFRVWASELLQSERLIAMIKDGFLVHCFETLSTYDRGSLVPFVLQLISIDKAQNYRYLKLPVQGLASRQSAMPESVQDVLKTVFERADISVEGLRMEEIDMLAFNRATDWIPILKASAIAIVAYDADVPGRYVAGGIVPQLKHFFPTFPHTLVDPPKPFGCVAQALYRVVGTQAMVFRQQGEHPEIISRDSAYLGNASSPRIVFGAEALTFTFGEPPQVNSRPALPARKISRIAVYKFVDPVTTTQRLTSLPTIAALAIRNNLSVLDSIGLTMQAISSSDPHGPQIVSNTCSALLEAFDGTEFADKANQFVIQTTSPGYAVSTDWSPILGTTTIGNGPQAIALRAEGCFAALSEPLQGKQVVLWDSKPTIETTIEGIGESPLVGAESSYSHMTDPAMRPTFTHFVLSAVTRNATQATPNGAIVFMSPDPIPTAAILGVPCRNVSEARKAKWPLPPTSVIKFTKSVPTDSGQNMVKSALVTIARPLQALFVMVMGLGGQEEGESSTSSYSPTETATNDLEPVIFSMILLGTTALPVKIPEYERLAYFFKSASISASCFVAPNNQLKGIIHFIGTDLGRKKWENPAEGGNIKIELSHSLYQPGVMKASNVVGRDISKTYWGSGLPVWFYVDLIDFRACPTHFAFRHGYEQDNSFIQNWKLQASHDLRDWTTVFHNYEKSHTRAYESILYKLDETPKEFYRYWRVITESNYWLGPNIKGNPMMCCSGFDLFGSLSKPPINDKTK